MTAESWDAAHWRALLHHASDLAWAARPDDGRLTVVSPATAQALGRAEADLLGTSAFDLVHPEDLEDFRTAWESLHRGDNRRSVLDCRVRQGDGGWLTVRQTLTHFLDDPAVRGIVGNASPRPAVPEQDRPRYRARFEQSPVPQTFVDASGRLTEVNQAFCDLVGCDIESTIGRHAADFQHSEDVQSEAHGLGRLIAGEVDSLQMERVLRHTDGRAIPCLVSGSILRGEDDTILGIAAFVQDLTPLRDLERRSQQQEDFFLAISQHATDLAVVADAEGRLVYTSPALTSRLGFEPYEVVGESGNHFVHPDDVPRNRAAFAQVVGQGGASLTVTLRLRNAAGEWRWYEETMRNLLNTPVGGVVCNMRDITDRVEAERSLRASEALYRAIADNADEGLWVVSPDARTLYVNHRMAEILGVDVDHLYGRPAPEVFGRDGDLIRHKIAHRRETGAERYEIGYDHPDGGRRILRFAAAPLPQDSIEEGSLAMVTDVTDARRLEEELRRAALHDSLTGLPNRALLLDRLEQSIQRGTPTAVLFVDLDQFKVVNDARGHAIGDALLVAVAARLRGAVRGADTVARFGGDEFVVVGEDVNDVGALGLAQSLLDALERPVEVTGGFIHITASIGVALFPPPDPDAAAPTADELLRNADTAMYAAKSAGRRGVRMFDQGLAADASERYRLAGDLRQAISNDELEVHFQPIVDLLSGRVRGVEALCRWPHSDLGDIAPDRFVPIADESGMARDLDRWVVCQALNSAGRLRASQALPGDAYVSVNLSARSFADVELEEHLVACTKDAGFDPGDVILEITEGAIMADPDAAAAMLGRLREAGFQVAIDDFGTGHSSLAYLDRFPVTTLKVDRSFVAELDADGTSRAIVASVLDLAHAIGVRVIAEGVETPAQAEHLRSLGCDTAQGWLWSRAVAPAEAEESGALSRTYDVGTSVR